jgi:DNA modification methylase
VSVRILQGDCRDVLKTLADASIDACVTDPPYELGFMGRAWDRSGIAYQVEMWREVLRVLKPGAHLVSFGGTRTYHRMASAIEDAGFEIRDQIGWLYGSGFPKSHNIGNGMGTALKPAWEPIVLARKPLIGTVAANVLEHGTGALNIDGCRVATDGETIHAPQSDPSKRSGVVGTVDLGISKADREKFQAAQRASAERTQSLGRWPANIIHDGSEEVLAAFAAYGESKSPPVGSMGGGSNKHSVYGDFAGVPHENGYGDTGTAARFFYSAKADADDRLGSKHPTVKPVDLMAYLVRLVTPPGGTVLDPFAGSGTTGMACLKEGFSAVLIEREAEYIKDIERRLDHVRGLDTPLFAQVAE